jgi:hypothetical protein
MSKDGGPAFPSGEAFSLDAGGRSDDRVMKPLHPGMTLRDYFAGQVIAALLVAPGQIGDEAWQNDDRAATWAYGLADAMLAAREAK